MLTRNQGVKLFVVFIITLSLAAFAGCGGKKKSSSSITTDVTGTGGTGTGGTGTGGTGTGGTGTGGTGTGIIAPDHLRNGIVGRAYSDTITLEMMGMADGVPPCTFEIISGAVPPGLDLNPDTGEVSGTPTTRGKYIFTVKMTDSNGDSTENQLQIIIESNDLWTNYVSQFGDTSMLRVWYIYVDSHERKWIGTNQGVYMFEGDGGSGMEWKHYTGMRDEDVHAITEDWDGNMWFGHRDDNDNGPEGITVLRTDGSYDTSYNTDLGRYIYCHDLLTDRKGRIWLVHYNGVHVYNPEHNTWTKVRAARSYAIAEDKYGDFWLAGDGHHGNMFGKFDGNTLEYTVVSKDGYTAPTLAVNLAGDKVWVRGGRIDGNSPSNIHEFDPATMSWTGNRFSGLSASSMNFDHNGNLWTAPGVVRKNGVAVKDIGNVNLGKEMMEEVIVIDRMNTKWMGTAVFGGGVYRYTGE
jgi:streptogramin lyase